jgi:hypothetical protein
MGQRQSGKRQRGVKAMTRNRKGGKQVGAKAVRGKAQGKNRSR